MGWLGPLQLTGSHTRTAPYLGIGTVGDLPQVILSPCSDLAKEQLLSHPAPQHHTHAVEELLPCVEVLLAGKVLSVAKPLAPRDDGHLKDKSLELEKWVLDMSVDCSCRKPQFSSQQSH